MDCISWSQLIFWKRRTFCLYFTLYCRLHLLVNYIADKNLQCLRVWWERRDASYFVLTVCYRMDCCEQLLAMEREPNRTELSVKYSRALSGGWVATLLLAQEWFIEFVRREIFTLYELKLAFAEVFPRPRQNCQCKISSNKHKVFTAETVSKKVTEKTLLHSSPLFHTVLSVTSFLNLCTGKNIHSFYIWKVFNVIASRKTQDKKQEKRKMYRQKGNNEMYVIILFRSSAHVTRELV
jgi:hypothetical protein